MKIAVEGCAHGELETIYDTIQCLEKTRNIKVDLLICCGDFQSTRNESDLRCMAIPPKYYNMCSFYKYYSGEKKAPILTIFIGGNHEASNYLQELPYGGWVAPNIYYMGYAGVINIAGIRIGGLSGIYKERDYMKGRFESAPYNENTKRSVYHVRNIDVFRMKQLSQPIDVFLSHDWPSGIYNFGNKNQLLRFKPHFREDIETGRLGSVPAEQLLKHLEPSYWFAAHLHCKFSAAVPHSKNKVTKFLSLDKCLPRRRYLQLMDIEHNMDEDIKITYDLEWLTILKLTNHLTSVRSVTNYMPSQLGRERYNFTPTTQEKAKTLSEMDNDLTVPDNFQPTAQCYSIGQPGRPIRQPGAVANPQTILLCDKIGIDDPLALIINLSQSKDNEVDRSMNQSINSTLNSTFNSTTVFSDGDLDKSDVSPRKRSSLVLPEPTQFISNNDESEELSKSNFESSTPSSGSSQIIENIGCMEISRKRSSPEIQTNLEEPPTNKKFKRRNASVYQSEY